MKKNGARKGRSINIFVSGGLVFCPHVLGDTGLILFFNTKPMLKYFKLKSTMYRSVHRKIVGHIYYRRN